MGGKLIGQIQQQINYLKEHLRLQIQVVGIANSKKMLLNDAGIQDWTLEEQLLAATDANIHSFVQAIADRNLRNSVL